MSPETKVWEELGNRTRAVADDYWRLVASAEGHAAELTLVEAALAADGLWRQDDEWRAMTWTTLSIQKVRHNEKDMFHVSVECDGQRFACDCPDLRRAYYFACWYRHLMIQQFHSIGPNWAEAEPR